MTDTLIATALEHLQKLDSQIQLTEDSSLDTIRLKDHLTTTLRQLHQAKQVDNQLLFALERFYQGSSMLIGLGQLPLNEAARKAWKTYDAFHFDRVKPELHLYGPIVCP